MTFTVEWDHRTKKFLKKLPKDVTQRIVLKVRDLTDDPFRYLEHFEGKSYYKFRIGDYRLLIDVDFSQKLLVIRVIGHRENIYEKI